MYKIRDWLYIGKFSETLYHDILKAKGITAMLQLAEPVSHEGIINHFIQLDDGVPMPHDKIAKGIQFIREQKAQGKIVLVACGAGISRSTIFTMAALMEEEDLELFEAYGEVYQKHPTAFPHHALCISLSEYYGKPLDLMEAHHGLLAVQKKFDEA